MNTPLITPTPRGGGRASLQSTTGRIAAVTTALLLVLFLVLSVSRAAFTANTDNSGNSIEAGTVTLTDNDGGSALFTIGDVQPGVDTVRCIQVRYDGNFTSGDIKMYVTPIDGETEIGDLADFVNVTVESVDQGANVPLLPEVVVPGVYPLTPDVSCAAYEVAALAGTEATDYDSTLGLFPTDYASGVDSGFTAEQTTRYFKITVSVENDPAAAGDSASWDFMWETQSA